MVDVHGRSLLAAAICRLHHTRCSTRKRASVVFPSSRLLPFPLAPASIRPPTLVQSCTIPGPRTTSSRTVAPLQEEMRDAVLYHPFSRPSRRARNNLKLHGSAQTYAGIVVDLRWGGAGWERVRCTLYVVEKLAWPRAPALALSGQGYEKGRDRRCSVL